MGKIKHQQKIAREAWHAFESEVIYNELKTSEAGLSSEEATNRLQFYGKNILPEAKKATLFKIIIHQLISPLIFILIAAAIASFAIGEGKDAIFIFLVIFINAVLVSYQEYNDGKSAAGLQKMLKINARIKRNGKEADIQAEEVVPGDIVLLESGVKVPDDVRIMEASNL